jgi:hypothetical protein
MDAQLFAVMPDTPSTQRFQMLDVVGSNPIARFFSSPPLLPRNGLHA